MNEEDFSLCIGCSYSGWCANLAKILVAYECDAYAPKEKEMSQKQRVE